MNFLNPIFLLGALAVAVPVVIHLINLRRPQKVAFSTLAFFEELKKSTIRRIRIKQYLLLALRVLAVLMLALALARPLLAPGEGSAASADEPKLVAVIIDNSPSMSRIGAEGPFLEQAKGIAGTIFENSGEEDRIIVTATNATGSAARTVSADRARADLQEMEISNSGNYLDDAVRMAASALKNSSLNSGIVYLLTDGQKSQMAGLEGLGEIDPGKSKKMALQVIKVGSSNQPNLGVEDIELTTQMLGRDNPAVLNVTVRNFGEAGAANQFVSVELGNSMVGQYEIQLNPGEERVLEYEVVPDRVGDIPGRVVIEGDEISFDNERFFVISIPRKRSVLLVEEGERGTDFTSYLKPALEAAQKSNTQISFERKRPGEIDQANWLNHDVIILNSLKAVPEYWFNDLQRYVQGGSGLLFFPSQKGDIENYNRFLGLFNAGAFAGIRGEYASFKPVSTLANLTEGHPILNDIFEKQRDEEIRVELPALFYYYLFESSGNAGSFSVLLSSTGDKIMAEQRFGEGRFLISAIGADPGWSNFPVNALFAPIYYRSVLYASSSEQGGLKRHILGEPFERTVNVNAQSAELELNKATYRPELERVPKGVRLNYTAKDWKPGILTVRAGDERRKIAVNQDIMESDFRTLDTKELETLLDGSIPLSGVLLANELSDEDLKNELKSASLGKEVWMWFIWAALLLLIVESAVSRLYKAESVS